MRKSSNARRRRLAPSSYPSAHALACALEARWFRLAVTPDGCLLVRPARWLTAPDRVAIAAHREALLRLVAETPEPVNGGLRFWRFDPRSSTPSTPTAR